MKKRRNLLFALIALMSLVVFPLLASADSGEQNAPLCTTLEDCQEMVAQYADLYGPLPSPTSASDPVANTDIEMTGGDDPPQDVVVQMRKYEGDLNAIALTYCTDPYWMEAQNGGVNFEGRSPQEAAEHYSSFEALGWQPVHDEYAAYLLQQAEAELNVPSRPPTLWELIQKYPGCEMGEYEAPSK